MGIGELREEILALAAVGKTIAAIRATKKRDGSEYCWPAVPVCCFLS